MKKFLILLVLSSNIFLNTYTAAAAAPDALTELKEASGKRKAEDVLEKSENSKT